MHFGKKGLLTALLAMAVSGSFAQTQSLEGFKTIRRSSISPIYQGREVAGYTLFYKSDKADKKNDNYGLDFYDQDLNKVTTLAMQKPRNKFSMLRNSYNGSAFCFYFYNHKEGALEMESYDAGLNKLGSVSIKDVSSGDKALLPQSATFYANTENQVGSLNLYPVPGKGFLRNSTYGLGRIFRLQMYDNNMRELWSFGEKKESGVETLGVYEVTDEYVLATRMTRSSIMTKKMDFSLLVLDVNTGTPIMETPVETDASEQLSLSSLFYDQAAKEFIAVGEFYKPNDKPFVNKSLGMYLKRFSQDGKALEAKRYSWDGEIRASIPAEARASIEKGYVNFTHRVLKGADGRFYVITEQYRIQASAGGIAMNVVFGSRNTNASTVEGSVANMLIFVLNPDFSVSDVRFVAKDKSKVWLPEGSLYQGAGLLGQNMKSWGDFDYQFSQSSNDARNFNIVYINYDKEKGEGTKKIIGNITNKEGIMTVDKIDGTTKATSSFVYPAKSGYVMMVDHLKKEGKLGMKLVKLNTSI